MVGGLIGVVGVGVGVEVVGVGSEVVEVVRCDIKLEFLGESILGCVDRNHKRETGGRYA